MQDNLTNPTTLGVVAILISTFGTIIGLYFNYKKDKRTAHKEDLQSAYDRLDLLEHKLEERDKLIEQYAEVIRQLKDQLAERDRTIADLRSQLSKLTKRVTKVEKKE